MRILHVNKFLYRRGGAESYMLDVARLQAEAGHDVEFFSMDHPENDASPLSDLFPTRMELDPPPSDVMGRIRTSAGFVWRTSAARGMEEAIERFRPDVAHLHNIYHQLSPSVLRPLRAARIPAVMTLHDYKLACPTYRFLANGQLCEACIDGSFVNAVQRRCNNGSLTGSLLTAVESSIHRSTKAYDPIGAFICPSMFMLNKMNQAGVYPDRLVHIPHFCDFDNITPATEPGAGVFFAGRLSDEKGVDTLIDAMAGLPDDVTLDIAGDGPTAEALKFQASLSPAADRIRFLGRLPASEVYRHIRDSAVVAVPSRWYENQPMIIIEAMGCARPVVGTDLGGISELIDTGVNGQLVPHNNPGALAQVIRNLVADTAKAHALGAQARDHVIDRFDTTTHLNALDETYEHVTRQVTG